MSHKIAFITNMCPNYRVKLFENIARVYDTDFIFFSNGEEWYWEKKNLRHRGKFKGFQLWGFYLFPKVRITPGLLFRLLVGKYDVFVKCINGRFALPVTFIIAKILRKPFILWTGVWRHPQTLFHKFTFPIVRLIYAHSDAIVVYGNHVMNYLLEIGIPSEKIFIGWNTIQNEHFNKTVTHLEKTELRKKLGLGNENIVLYVGRIEREKGLEYLLQAFARLEMDKNAALLFVGRGSYRNKMELRAKELGIKKILFTDYVVNTELYKYYSIADVFVLPSITTRMFKEPWGLVINEAMNQGCPVVTTDAVGAAMGGLIENTKTGFIVPECDTEALTKAIFTILDDSKLAEQLRINSLDKIKHWDYNHQSKGFCDAIESVLK